MIISQKEIEDFKIVTRGCIERDCGSCTEESMCFLYDWSDNQKIISHFIKRLVL